MTLVFNVFYMMVSVQYYPMIFCSNVPCAIFTSQLLYKLNKLVLMSELYSCWLVGLIAFRKNQASFFPLLSVFVLNLGCIFTNGINILI